MTKESIHHLDSDLVLQDAETELQPPSMYRVLLLNDDYTPMEFVVDVLVQFFHMSEEQAPQIMLNVHTQGVGVCGVYPRDIAETRVQIVNRHAREHQHPLLCTMEPV